MKLLMQNFIYSGVQAALRIINNMIAIVVTINYNYGVYTYFISQISFMNNQIVILGYTNCTNNWVSSTSYTYISVNTNYCGTTQYLPSQSANVNAYWYITNVPANLTALYSIIYLPNDIT